MKTKTLLSIIIFLAILLPGFSQTNISSGPVSGIWTKEESPYRILGDISIADGTALVIEQGVKVEFMGHYRFTVAGNLKALGTKDEMIHFTKTDTLGLSNRNTPNGSWNGLVFNYAQQDTNIIDYCIIEYCNSYEGLSAYNERSPINGFYSTLVISNSVIRKNYSMYGAVKIDYGDFQILNNTFDSNTGYNTAGAIFTNTNGPKLIEGNTITNNIGLNGGGIYIGAGGLKVIVRNNFISQNSAHTGGGITAWADASGQITQNIIVNNTSEYGGGIAYLNSGMVLLNNTICNNSARKGAGIYFSQATLMDGQNNIIWGNRNLTQNENIYVEENSFPKFDYNFIEDGNASFLGSPDNILSQNMFDGEPDFANPTPGTGTSFPSLPEDWKLNSTSLCINAGSIADFSDKIPELDYFENTRIAYELLDLGAHEFNIPILDVTSDITVPTQWIADTVKIWNDIDVSSKLTIAPGVVVEFQGFYSISFTDTLYAVGTPDNPIKFMNNNTDGLYNKLTNDGTFNTIQFNGVDGIIIKYCEIRHAKFIRFIDCDNIVFENNLVEDCKADNGLSYFGGYNNKIVNNIFRNNFNRNSSYYVVLGVNSEKTLVKGNKFYNNDLTILENYGNNLKFINNLVYNNSDRVILLRNGYNAVFVNNTFAYNGSGFTLEGGSSYIANNIFYKNGNTEISSLIYVDEIKLFNNLFEKERVPKDWETNLDNIIANPLFRNPYPFQGTNDEVMNSDYSLMDISPAIDMGFNNAKDVELIDKDVFGKNRINNALIDIGAVENQGSIPVVSAQPRGGSFCENEALSIEITPNTSDTLLYRWKKNGKIIPGENTRYLNFDSVSIDDAGYYTCMLINSYGKTESYPAALNIKTLPVILFESESKSICEGDAISLEITASGDLPLEFSWTKDGNALFNKNKPRLLFAESKPFISGIYKAYVSNGCGIDSSSELEITVNSLPIVKLGKDTSLCANSSFILDPGIYHNYLWNDFTTNRYKDIEVTGEYFVRVTDRNGCENYSDTVYMQINEPFSDQTICVVTVDPQENKNLIAWNRIEDVGVRSYNIYKLYGNNFVPIGFAPIGDITQFIDYTSSPNALAARYAISVVDTCGNESEKSFYHQTIHLGASEGITPNTVILDWTEYIDESGVYQPEWYYVFRGEQSDNMILHDSISSSFTEWNDLNPGNSLYYQIGVKMNSPCNPSDVLSKKAGSGPFIHSLSNLEDTRIKTGIFENESAEISIYPNPMENFASIDMPDNQTFPLTLKILDMNGRILRETEYYDNHIIIEREDLMAGFYFIEIVSDAKYIGKMMVQ